jgi:ribonuclease I
MVRLNGEIKQSHLGAFLAKHYGQTVSRDDFNAAVAQAYGKQNVKAFKLTCNGNPAYLTEMQISIKAAAINAPLSADSFLPQPHPGTAVSNFCWIKPARFHTTSLWFVDECAFNHFKPPASLSMMRGH